LASRPTRRQPPAAGKAGARASADVAARRYDPAETRSRVLEAAYMLFGKHGYSATGTADIAREADVSEGSIFYHFGSKHALLIELGRLHGEKMIAAMEAGDDIAGLSFDVTINRCFDFCEVHNMWDEVGDGDCHAKTAAGKHNPDSAPFFEATREVVVDWTRRHIEALARREGYELPNSAITAQLVFALVGAALQQYFADGTSTQDQQRIRRETVRFLAAATLSSAASQ